MDKIIYVYPCFLPRQLVATILHFESLIRQNNYSYLNLDSSVNQMKRIRKINFFSRSILINTTNYFEDLWIYPFN